MASHYSTLQVRQALKRLGFSDNEIKVLIFLFYAKQSTAKAISKETVIAFSSTQYCLSNLSARNLVKVIPAKEDFFEIISEKELFEWIDKAKEKNEQIYERSKEEIHSFFSIIQNKSWKPQVQYYEGREGVIEIYEDMLKTAEDIYSWIDIQKIYDALGSEYLNNFIKQRVNKNIKVHAIMPINNMNIKHETRDENRDAKFVKNFPIKGEIRIYNDKVAVITFDKEKPVGFIFEGVIITDLFKTIFINMWDNI